jgi:hypothetical protein
MINPHCRRDDDASPNLCPIAEAYAARRWPVFPLHTPDSRGRCSCGRRLCDDAGKHPRTRRGVLDATVDGRIIEAWWRVWPSANLAIATGPAGLAVLDVDPEHGGLESLERLGRRGIDLPLTLEARTGSGGRHLYYRRPDGIRIRNSAGRLGPGLDIRGEGGYVVAPPSLHASGRPYTWVQETVELEPALLPAPLVRLLAAAAPQCTTPMDGRIPRGQRNSRLASYAGALRRLGASQPAIFGALCAISREDCDEPLSEDEVARIATSICRYLPESQPRLRTRVV